MGNIEISVKCITSSTVSGKGLPTVSGMKNEHTAAISERTPNKTFGAQGIWRPYKMIYVPK